MVGAGWLVTCPECNGNKGWTDIDGRWAECFLCNGHGHVDEDELEDSLDDDE